MLSLGKEIVPKNCAVSYRAICAGGFGDEQDVYFDYCSVRLLSPSPGQAVPNADNKLIFLCVM